MIHFDPRETLLFNVGVNAFSCMITAMVYFRYKKDFADTYDNLLLRRLQAAVFWILFTDILTWLINGRAGETMRRLGYCINIFYFVLQLVIALYWLRYAWYRIFGQSLPRKKEVPYILLPFAVLGLLILSSPLNGWCFYLDEANRYHRGPLAASLFIVLLVYLLIMSGIALVQYQKETLIDRKKELQLIAFFAVPPILGGTAQTFTYGFSLVWPLAAISCLLVLHEKDSRAISQDALTGLNNRRNMERYLGARKEAGQNRPIALILLDVNDFKHINDHFGHEAGDAALIYASDILREIFNGTDAFLARYGGDEFVIVMPENRAEIIEDILLQIKKRFEACGQAHSLPFCFSVSAGYAVYSGESEKISELFARADERMYRDKALYHQRKAMHPQ
jgi:diguanylate cyclase (GGDEF)-like protein